MNPSRYVLAFTAAICLQGQVPTAAFIASRALSSSGFAGFAVTATTFVLVGSVAMTGLSQTATKRVAELHRQQPRRAGSAAVLVLVSCGVWGGLATAASLVAGGSVAMFLATNITSEAVRSCAGYVLFMPVGMGCIGILSGLEKFGRVARALALGDVIGIPTMAWLATHKGLIGALLGLSVVAACSTGMLCVEVLRCVRRREIQPHRPGLEARQLLVFVVPAILSTGLVGPSTWLCTIMLSRLPNGVSEVASFYSANQWRGLAAFGPSVVAQVALPRLAGMFGVSARGYARAVLSHATVAFSAAVAIVLGLGLFGPQLMAMFGRRAPADTVTLRWLLVAVVISSTANVAGAAITGAGRMWGGLGLNIVWAAALLTLALLLLGRGAPGISAAFAGAYLLHAVVVSVYMGRILTRRTSRLQPQDAQIQEPTV